MVRIAVDIGGTFTDVVAETAGRLSSIKILTTTASPEEAALEGIDRVLADHSLTPSAISSIVHGTTLATNALIERRGAKTAFVTTSGFRDVLEMRHEKRFDQYALDIEMPDALVPRPLRLTVGERVLSDGSVLQAPDDDEIASVAEFLRAHEVEAVAIGLLHSYRNPAHEQLVANRFRELLGNGATICQSAEVAGEIREYDRFSTVCANAYVRPLVSRYLERLHGALRERGFKGSFLMMQSDGGLTTLDLAVRFPIRLAEGGPAGGVALAAHVAKETGSAKTLSLDIGGTTAKICFIENGQPQTTRRFEVARAWRDTKGSGLPIRVPTVELVEIGAGGGSIASVDSLGRLKVGPKSAGSNPGPAAYNRGGKDATITDAHLTVGNIAADGFADGIIEIVPQHASRAIADQVQPLLGTGDVETAAAGIIEMADETMANAARVHGIELGLDISKFDLLVSGGGGGLHATRFAEKLGIRRIIVPQNAGVGSAVGILRSPIAFAIALSVMEPVGCLDAVALKERVEAACESVREVVAGATAGAAVTIAVNAELRYLGQGLDISLPLSIGGDFAQSLEALKRDFNQRYGELVGYTLDSIEIELVSLTVSAREPLIADAPSRMQNSGDNQDNSSREIYDLEARECISYREIKRSALNGSTLPGPIVLPEPQTTTLVRSGWTVRRSDPGHLVLERR